MEDRGFGGVHGALTLTRGADVLAVTSTLLTEEERLRRMFLS